MKSSQCPYCQSYRIIKNGFSRPRACAGGAQQQSYRCLSCLRRFSDSSSKIWFRYKKKDLALSYKVFEGFIYGQSNRQIAFRLKLSEHCVRQRLDRLAKQAILFHAALTKNLFVKEPIAYDGLENFAFSQYDPNNIQHAVGAKSLFVYDFNFAPMNRKGRMSIWQKRKEKKIEELEGRYDPSAIRRQSLKVFQRLSERSVQKLELLTDEHFQYKRALKRLTVKVSHKTVNSRVNRNHLNILFSVNHADLLVRQRVKAFARETISFSKTAGRMCQKYFLFIVHKNYMLPQFTKKQVRRSMGHKISPAEHVGVADRVLSFADIFRAYPRRNVVEEAFPEEWKYFYDAQVPEDCRRNQKFKRRPKQKIA